MKLSEERIHFIAEQIVDALLKKNMISSSLPRRILVSELAKVIISDLKTEEEIDKEVKAMIENMKRSVPEGSAEWQSVFRQLKEDLARRRNYVF